jgi:hypothetical protein
MVNYPTGMYFLIMQNISEEIKSFKIIKTQWEINLKKIRSRISPDSEAYLEQ